MAIPVTVVPCSAAPYLSHLLGGGYNEGAEACWLAMMAEDERPEKWKQTGSQLPETGNKGAVNPKTLYFLMYRNDMVPKQNIIR